MIESDQPSELIERSERESSLGSTTHDGDEHSNFHYTPLTLGTKAFRLITILAGRGTDELLCLLHHVDLDTELIPQYETVSYCWGDVKVRCSIWVDGTTVLLPASTVAALRRMRLPYTDRVVWLDALCIDQKNNEERSQQVSMMGDIYRNGTRNLIYLGEDNVDYALTSITSILAEALADELSFKRLRNNAGAWQYSETGIKAVYDIAALRDFFSISWFRRLWVLQEAALARENLCYCGSAEINLVEITRVAGWLIYNYYFVDPDLRLRCSYAADMNDLVDNEYGYHRSKAGESPSVYYLLDLAQQRLSTLDVDKIYGILGLTTELEEHRGLPIEVDYKKTTAEVFRDTAHCLIRMSGDLQVLDYVRHWTIRGNLVLDDFPSWVPKWHRSKDLDEHPNFMSLSFRACNGRQASMNPRSSVAFRSPHKIEATGILVDFIQENLERIAVPEADRTIALGAMLKHAEIMTNKTAASHELSAARKLSFATCMVAGVDASFKLATEDIIQGYDALRTQAGSRGVPSSISQLDDSHNEQTVLACHYAEAMWNACMNRSFFVTRTGHFGLGPYFMNSGDVLAILYGLNYPAILRPVAEGEYLFLGVAYGHGMMHGETVRAHGTAGNADNVFVIR